MSTAISENAKLTIIFKLDCLIYNINEMQPNATMSTHQKP